MSWRTSDLADPPRAVATPAELSWWFRGCGEELHGQSKNPTSCSMWGSWGTSNLTSSDVQRRIPIKAPHHRTLRQIRKKNHTPQPVVSSLAPTKTLTDQLGFSRKQNQAMNFGTAALQHGLTEVSLVEARLQVLGHVYFKCLLFGWLIAVAWRPIR